MKVKTKSKKVKKAWLNEHVNDPYVKLAQREGYRSRAAYKLQEIDETLGLFRPGQTVIDLGASPGAWSQYIRHRFSAKRLSRSGQGQAICAAPAGMVGRVIALDVLPLEPIEGVQFVQGDFREESVAQALAHVLGGQQADVIVSDMAPNLSGVEMVDAARMTHLVELALAFAAEHLRPEGVLACKVFHGRGYSQIVEAFKRQFGTVKPIKPKASRDRSAETFLIGLRLKQGLSS